MLFKSTEHRQFFEECIERTGMGSDPYHKALFYTLGLLRETRRNIEGLYDFKKREINFDGLTKAWQTGTSLKATRMAFNLFNGFSGKLCDEQIEPSALYSPYYLCDNELMCYFFEALKLRYPTYCLEKERS